MLARRALLAHLAAMPAFASDSTDPADVRRAFRKLRYRLDDGVVFWWMEGIKYGQVDADVRPLFVIDVGFWFKIANQADGGVVVSSYELVFYRDLDTGKLLSDWLNPYTGEKVAITNRPIGPNQNWYRPDGSLILPTELGGAAVTATNTIGPMLIEGDDVWVHDDYTAAVTPPGGGAPFRVNDWTTYRGSRAQVLDPAVTNAEASAHAQEVTSWQRWMNMADRPGTMYSRTVGRKVARFDNMPDRYRRTVAERYPDIARDPLGSFQRAPEKFER